MNLEEFYNKRYKIILLIPIIIFVISLLFIVSFYFKNGDILKKDVSLSGGVSATIYANKEVNINEIEDFLRNNFDDEIFVRRLVAIEGSGNGILIETSNQDYEKLKNVLEENLKTDLNDENFFVEQTGSNLGEDFYKQMIRAFVIAFVFIAIVMFIIFRKIVPSVAVIFSILFDMIVTIALINLIGVRVSSAGISALLFLLGSSVDNNILLNTKMLKRKEGSLWERMLSATKTGLTMITITLVAMSVAYIFSESFMLKQMFGIIFIGLIVDIISTYGMNSGIIKWYIERKKNE